MKKLKVQLDEKQLKIANDSGLSLAKLINGAIELYDVCSRKEITNEQKLNKLNHFLHSIKKQNTN